MKDINQEGFKRTSGGTVTSQQPTTTTLSGSAGTNSPLASYINSCIEQMNEEYERRLERVLQTDERAI